MGRQHTLLCCPSSDDCTVRTILTGKHPSGSLGVLYKTTYEGLLPVVLEADPLPPTPTAVAVFPVVLRGGKMQTENVVVAGFSDGGLRFYKSVSTAAFVEVEANRGSCFLYSKLLVCVLHR